MTIPSRNLNYPTAIKFGAGRIRELADHCKANGITRPLFVTDPGLAAMPMVGKVVDDVKRAGLGIAVFSDVRSNPVEANVIAGVRAYQAGDHDGVVAFGGGSGLDVGKLVALMHGQGVSLFELEDVDDWWTRADASKIAPIIAVPTTAGTGSEVGRAGVVTHPETHEKKIIFHPAIMPRVAILDPELTVGLPPELTAATGMDAMAHCVESYCALLSPAGSGRGPRGAAADQGEPVAGGEEGCGHRRARAHADGLHHGRYRVPARARRHPRALAPVRRPL